MPFAFQIFEPDGRNAFSGQLDELAARLAAWLAGDGRGARRLVQARVYLTDMANWLDAFRAHELYAGCLSRVGVSLVGQPPLGGAKVALQVCAVADGEAVVRREDDSFVVEHGGVTYLWQSVRLAAAEARGLDARQQTRLIFSRHIGTLKRRGWNLLDNCLRTWIYVRDIDLNYAEVVAGRNEVFAEEGLTPATHFIASTGIGGENEEPAALVAIDFLSVAGLPARAVSYLQAPAFLNPTYEYGVAFERATAVAYEDARMVLVSGTASIDREGRCLHRGDVLTQAGRLLLNVGKLIEAAGGDLKDLLYVVAYLRDVSDAPALREYMRLRFPRLPFLLVEGRVCRSEWLVEMEGIASVRS